MLAETLSRCAALAPPEHTFVITNRLQLEATRRECPELPREQIVAEPAMRNTAAAIGLAALHARRHDPEGVMVVLPADHVIRPQDAFENCFRAAIRRARDADVLLTIGIQPTGPATGYGYIESGDEVASIDGHIVQRVESFKEKPSAAKASEFIATGRYFWNAGTFVWRISTLMAAYRRYLPRHHEVLEAIDAGLAAGRAPAAEDYERFDNIPIDMGIMERADNVEVIPALFEWDDVGSWLAVDRLHPRDEDGNVIRGEHTGVDTRNCIVISRDHLVATVGIRDMIVVHTPDATLICPKDRAEEVRDLVRRLAESGGERYL
jgi:mannose-1-phosphate guanylyltransferase